MATTGSPNDPPREPTPDRSTLPLDQVRLRLAQLWFLGAGAIFLLLVGQSLGNTYIDRSVVEVKDGDAVDKDSPKVVEEKDGRKHTKVEKTQDRRPEVWSAMVPTFLPTLTLIATVFGANALLPKLKPTATDPLPEGSEDPLVRRGFFQLTFGVSAAYLFLILATILAEPLVSTYDEVDRMRPADLLKLANLWLAPMQSLVVLLLSVLFFTQKSQGK
jgi:hypothetical protein